MVQHADVQRKASNVDDGARDVLYVKSSFDFYASIRLRSTWATCFV